jgi:hypothetical protein
MQNCGITLISTAKIATPPPKHIVDPRANGAERRSGRKLAQGESTNSPRLFTPGGTKALAKSKVHQ